LRIALIDWQLPKVRNRVQLPALFMLGAILAGAAELPFGGWIQIPILSLIWWQLKKLNHLPLKNSFIAGMCFGLGYFVLGLWWIYISLHDIGGLHWTLSAMAVFLLAACLSVYFSAASLSIRIFKSTYLSGLVLAASWVLLEYLRGQLFTGFPWMGLAETQFNGPFAPVAPLLGGLACTFLTVWISWEILQARKHLLFSAIGIFSIVILSQAASLISFTKPVGEPISIRLIQGNYEQSLKFNPQAVGEQIIFYAAAIQSTPADLIVIPETAFPWPQGKLPNGLLDSLQKFSNVSSSNLLLGVIGEISGSKGLQYSNRALGLSPNSQLYQYDKSHLVPFGEFVPTGFRWFVKAFGVPLNNFSRGAQDQPLFAIKKSGQDPVYAAITICYEDVFGSELAARLRESDQPANLMINITNLAWFGASQAPTQQLRLSQLRSLETGLPALRATNTGITAVLGPDGKVLEKLPEFTQGTLSATVQAYSGKTPYVIWGNTPILSISCLLLLLGFIRQKQFW
jgi:apolipoprotein N-acyltransferase